MFSLPVWLLRAHGVDLVAVVVAGVALQRLMRTYLISHGQSDAYAAKPIDPSTEVASKKDVLANLAPIRREAEQQAEQPKQSKLFLYWAVLMVTYHITGWVTLGSVWPLQTDADALSNILIVVLPFLLSLEAIYALLSIFVLNTKNWQEDPRQQPEYFRESLRRNMLCLAVGSPLFAVFVTNAFSTETLSTRPWACVETAIYVTQAVVWLYFVQMSKGESDQQCHAGARA